MERAMVFHSSTFAWKIHRWRSLVAAVHGVAKSRTQLSDFTFTFHFHAMDKEMATHSSVLAWRIPGTREPGGLPSVGLYRVGHNWSDLAAAVMTLKFFIYLLLAVLGLCYCKGFSLAVAWRLLIAAASLVAEYRLWDSGFCSCGIRA